MNEVIQRALDVWKPDFLKKFLSRSEKSQKTTWLFWFLSGAIAALVWAFVAVSWSAQTIPEAVSDLGGQIPEGAKIQMLNNNLSTENIEPFRKEIDTETGKALFVIDTQEDVYSEDYSSQSLEDYESGAIILQDRFYIKDGTEINTEKFKEVPNFSLTKEQLMTFLVSHQTMTTVSIGVAMFFIMFSLFAVTRLLTAWWWTLLMMLTGKLFGFRATWSELYFVVLNLYFVPLVIEGALLVLNVHIPLISTLIFALLFALNLSEWKKSSQDDIDQQKEVVSNA